MHRLSGTKAVWVGVALAISLNTSSLALAQSSRPLPRMSVEELALLAELGRDSTVAWVEQVSPDELPGIVMVRELPVRAERVVSLLTKPESFPRHFPLIEELQVTDRSSDAVAYTWAWSAGPLRLEGDSTLNVFARRGSPLAETRVDIANHGGDFGEGKLSFRVQPLGETTRVILESRFDFRDANYVTRELSVASRDVARGLNFAFAIEWMDGVCRAFAPESSAVRKYPLWGVWRRRVQPLLVKGDLVWVGTDATGIPSSQTWMWLAEHGPAAKRILQDPERFAAALVPGSYARVTERSGGRQRFDWGIDLPLVGVRGVMTLVNPRDAGELVAEEGALKGGRWSFRVSGVQGGSVLVGRGVFDLRETTWLLRRVVDASPGMRVGLTGTMELLAARAIRSAAKRLTP